MEIGSGTIAMPFWNQGGCATVQRQREDALGGRMGADLFQSGHSHAFGCTGQHI